MRRLTLSGCTLLFAFVGGGPGMSALAEDDAHTSAPLSDVAGRILAITDVVLSQHIDPPTRQQMILEGVKALYEMADSQPPPSLSAEVSALATDESITAYVNSVRDEFVLLPDLEAVMLAGVLQALPGEASLIPNEESRIQHQIAANRYVGIGVLLANNREERLKSFRKVLYNGPAWHAGAKDGDLIVEIDGEPMDGVDMRFVVEKLRGASASDVTLALRQPGETESRTLTMTRGRVFIPSIEGFKEASAGHWNWQIDSAPDIALVRVVSIGPSTLSELRQVAAALRKTDVRGIVLNLRGGGDTLHDLHDSIVVADALLDGGTIGHVKSRDGRQTHKARPGALFQGLPMAVLIDRNSDTDRVFLAAALQDHKRAVVVGERTESETYVNSVVDVPGSSEQLRLATGLVQRADGTTLLAAARPKHSSLRMPSATATNDRRKQRNIIVPDHVISYGTPTLDVDPFPALSSAIRRLTKNPAASDSKSAFELLKTAARYTEQFRTQGASDPMLAKAIDILQAGDAALPVDTTAESPDD